MTHDVLIHVLRTGAVLAVLALTIRGLRHAPATLQHRLWWLGLLQLCVPAGWLATRVLPERTLDAVSLAVDWPGLLPTASAATASGGVDAETVLAVLWTAGAVLMLGRLVLNIRSATLLKRRSRACTGRLPALADELGLDHDRLRVSDEMALPAVAGWWRPVILMPATLADGLPAPELRAVLRHENAHRLRRDPLRMAAARALRALVWWHPGAWWALRHLEDTAEYACDEAAAPDPADGERLADALARSLRIALDDQRVVLSASLAGGRVPLRRRLRRLTRNRRSPSMNRIRLMIVVAVLAVSAGTLLAVPAPEAPPAPPVEPAPPADVAEPVPAPEAEPLMPTDEAPGLAPAAPVAPVADVADDDPAKKAKQKARQEAMPPKLEKPDVQAKLVKFVEPEFPQGAIDDGSHGTIVVVAVIDEKGVPVKILKTGVKNGVEDKRLVKAAIKALKQCRFEPATKDGRPVKTQMSVPFRFELD